jgi:Tol biopolymer transport system component
MPTICSKSTAGSSRRAALLRVCFTLVSVAGLSPASALAQGPIVPGFNANSLPGNDDGSTGQVAIGFPSPINFFGSSASTLFVNNNGNVTFDQPLSTFTPFILNSTNLRIIAPFFADVDTSGTGAGTVTYGSGMINGRPAFGVNWLNVDYFPSGGATHTSRNSFQLILIDRSDTGAGNFDFWFNYGQIQWETGGASGGDVNGLGGFSARVGYSNGLAVSYEQTGSGVNGALLDSNPSGLVHNQLNSGVNGRYVFAVRNGIVNPTLTITTMTPRSGSTAGGTPVVVTGTNFLAGTSVTVGGRAAAVVSLSATRLSFVSPPGNAGPAPLVVSNSSGSTTSTFQYELPAARLLAGARRSALSFDGRYTAFESSVALVEDDTNGISDVYVYDKVADTLQRVSVSSAGTQATGGESGRPAISASGRFVAFESRAFNLVPDDSNGLQDVFLHDRDADQDGVFDELDAISTRRISITSAGGQGLHGGSGNPSISGNGQWVAFETYTDNLVGSDTNQRADICVHDRLNGQTRRINVSTAGVEAIGGASLNPVIALNGRYVAYESDATNLVAGDTNAFRDVFLHDRDVDGDGIMDEAGSIATRRVSVATGGAQALGGNSSDPSITQEGRWIAFGSTANNLVANDTNNESDIFLHDASNNTTIRLSQGPNGAQWIAPSFQPVLSANGLLLVFLTSGLNAPPVGGATSGSVFGGANDGKSTTGTIPLPTEPVPTAPSVQQPPPADDIQDPAVSGDGSQTGATVQPRPGSGGSAPSVSVEGPPAPPPAAAAPFLSALGPAQGPTTGGNVVDVQGAHFQANATVRWNGVALPPSEVSFVNSALLRVTAPAGTNAVSVQVQSGGQATNVLTYIYQANLSSPRITSFTPGSGLPSGGTVVTLSGTGFSSPSVRFGPNAAQVDAATATSVTVRAPAAAVAGPVPIVLTNGDGALTASDSPYTYVIPAPSAAPSIMTLLPTSGAATGGTVVTIRGENFAPGATVTFGGVPATDVQVLSNTDLLVVTPAGPEGPATIIINGAVQSVPFQYLAPQPAILSCTGADTGDGDFVPDAWENQYGLSGLDSTDAALDADGDGRTNAQECADGTHPRGLFTRFLAEGATGTFFTTRIALANPNAAPARVLLRFLTGANQTVPWFLTIPGNARRTIDVEQLAGLESANVSAVVESDTEVVVDRTMRWDRQTRGGAHAESSVPAPALRWYLAEGATHGFFDLFYLIQNPSLSLAASVRIRFLRPSGAPVERFYTVPANSRFTLPVDQIPELAETDLSAVIESTNNVPIIVERAMYSSAAGVFAAGHDSAGVTALSTQWFFAEGATGSFFDLFLLFANPNTTPAAVEATYLLPSGATVVKSYTIPAESRQTVYVANEDALLADTAVSVKVRVTNPGPGMPGIIVERAMWWPHGQNWYEAHNSAGSTVTGTKWAVADGEEGLAVDGTQTYILIANTSAVEAHLRVTVLLETGVPLVREYRIAANSRFNVPVGPDFGLVPGTRFSTVVESLGTPPAQIVVERAMYWNAAGVIWAAGSNVLATKLQ